MLVCNGDETCRVISWTTFVYVYCSSTSLQHRITHPWNESTSLPCLYLHFFFLLWRQQHQPSNWLSYYNIYRVAQGWNGRTAPHPCLGMEGEDQTEVWVTFHVCPGTVLLPHLLRTAPRHTWAEQVCLLCVHTNHMNRTMRSSVLRSEPGPLSMKTFTAPKVWPLMLKIST